MTLRKKAFKEGENASNQHFLFAHNDLYHSIIYLEVKILEFPSEINFDIITSDDINFNFHFMS